MKRMVIFAVLGASLVACLPREEYPPVPQLTFVSLQTTGDSAIIRLEFTDGDGNFGLTQADTAGVFDDCMKRYNLYAEYYELQNGEWVHRPIDPCINENAVPFYYRIPFVEPTGQRKSQKGEIQLVITPFYYLSGEFDTCRFEIRAVDRLFNESNEVRTSSFIKP